MEFAVQHVQVRRHRLVRPVVRLSCKDLTHAAHGDAHGAQFSGVTALRGQFRHPALHRHAVVQHVPQLLAVTGHLPPPGVHGQAEIGDKPPSLGAQPAAHVALGLQAAEGGAQRAARHSHPAGQLALRRETPTARIPAALYLAAQQPGDVLHLAWSHQLVRPASRTLAVAASSTVQLSVSMTTP